jgi:hypothetical protein
MAWWLEAGRGPVAGLHFKGIGGAGEEFFGERKALHDGLL